MGELIADSHGALVAPSTTINTEKIMAKLMTYNDATEIREATQAEVEASTETAKRDGGAGAITVEIDGEKITCYVQD